MLQPSLPDSSIPQQCSTPRYAAIYCRVSTRDQSDNGFSLPDQREACLTAAQQAGYTVLEHHIFSEDYPGMSLRRPELTRLRSLVRDPTLEAVYIWDLDRLSRQLAHKLLLTEEFEQADVVLCEVRYPTTAKTPENALLSNMHSMIAEYEHDKLLERTFRGLVGRAKAGRPPGGPPHSGCGVSLAMRKKAQGGSKNMSW